MNKAALETYEKSTHRFSFKSFFRSIARFVHLLFHPSEKKIDHVNKTLEKAVRNEIIERLKLKREIKKFVRKNYGVRLSKYMPRKSHNPAEIYGSVRIMYGDRMKDLSLELTKNLTWKQ